MAGEGEWYEPILAFGADLQRQFNTVAPIISPLYGGINYLTGGSGQTFGDWAKNIETGNNPAEQIRKGTVDAWNATIKWGEDTQKNIQWLAGGAAGFLDTAGKFTNALIGGQGILGQLGAMLPVVVIGLLAFMVMRR